MKEDASAMVDARRIILISCSKSKLTEPAPAERLYAPSALFRKQLAWARRLEPDGIYILSARYGLLDLQRQIEPYEQTLKTMSVSECEAWGARVAGELARVADLQADHFVLLGGRDYGAPLAPHICHLEQPLAGLPQGVRLQALTFMSEWMPEHSCAQLHALCQVLPRHTHPVPEGAIPTNGIYLLFEHGEVGHGAERIVRVGTHRGDGQLPGRVAEHFQTENRHRSIFRKNIGRALLARRGDCALLRQWEIDLTTRAGRERYEGSLDDAALAATEQEVTNYIQEHFRVTCIPVPPGFIE